MKKQKNKLSLIACIALASGLFFAHVTTAATTFYGDAIVSWAAPTTDEGGGALGGGTSDLAGYRVYYSTASLTTPCANWGNAAQSDRQANTGNMMPSTYKTVTSGTALAFSTPSNYVLTLGQTYYFAVVAYDTTGNLSKCATLGTSATDHKQVTFPADISTGGTCTGTGTTHCVNMSDYTLFHSHYGNVGASDVADINSSIPGDTSGLPDGKVDGADFSLMHAEYGQAF